MTSDDRLREAAEAHGTPVYVYDLDAVADRAATLRAALPERVEIAFAVKANPSLAVLRAIGEAGLGADVASSGELEAVLRAGFDPERVIFTGPGKRDAELARAASLPLRAVTVESPGEVERLAAAARDAGRTVRVQLRAGGGDRPGNVIGSGHGRFGMTPADLDRAADAVAGHQELELIGLHRFEASNLVDADELLGAARVAVGMATELAGRHDVRLGLVDIGGGLGIPYADGEARLDVDRFGAGLERLLDELDREPMLAGASLLVEPGRWLVGPCGAYVTRVLDVKEGPHGTVATVDGGVHHVLRPVLVGQAHRIRSLVADRPVREVIVGGPLCTGLDVLGRARLPAPEVGDLLVVADVGAYGYTESMPLFLSHPLPAEVVVRGGRMSLARRRVEPEELLTWQADVLTEASGGA